MIKQITSAQNPAVKRLLQLQEKSRNRRKEGVFIVEGLREIQLAFKGNYICEEFFFCDSLFPAKD